MNYGRYVDAVANINLFSSFTKDELKKIFNSPKVTIKEYSKGQVIHIQNEQCHTMDIILHGKLAVQKIDENGNVLTINVFYDRDIVGVNLLFSSKNAYPMTVVALTNITILHLQRDLVLELCQRDINFMTGLMREIADKTIILTEKINTLSFKTIRQCIIDFLQYEYYIQQSNVIKLNTTKKEIAEKLGIQRSSLSRELNKMRKDGLLEYDAKAITLKKMSF